MVDLCEELKKGLYNWYPFKEGATIYYALDGDVEGLQELACESVDYIVASYIIEKSKNPVELLTTIYSKLKKDGHLLVGCENRLGLRYFCGDREPFTEKCFDGLENYSNYYESDRGNIDGRLYAGYELKEFLEAAGFNYSVRYTVLPGLEMPQQLYASDYLPEEEIEIRFTRIYHNPDTVYMYEDKLYDSLIKNGTFHQMANAYLFDCSKNNEFYEINHVTTSMDRGNDKAMATIIEKSGKVIKKALYNVGNDSIKTLLSNTEDIVNSGISVVPLELKDYENGCLGVSMPYVKADTALTYLRETFKQDKELFKSEVERYISVVLASSKKCENQPKDNELGDYYEKVYIDMVPLNCFYIDGDFVFYDQEYVLYNYPINVLLFRILDIIYMNDRTMLGEVPFSYFTDKYGFTKKVDLLRKYAGNYIEKLRNRDVLASYNAKHLATFESINTNRQKVNYSLEKYIDIFADVLKNTQNKDVYIFGAGKWARKFYSEYKSQCNIKAFIDNSSFNQGNIVDGLKVIGPMELANVDVANIKVIVCVKYYSTILLQLKKLGITNYAIYDPFVDYSYLLKQSETIENKVDDRACDETYADKKYKVGYIAGVFDLFHRGHLNLLRRAKEQCEYLIVGVVSDEQARASKKKSPYVNEDDRVEIVRACKYVDNAEVLPRYSSGTKDAYKRYHFDVQFSGSDYEDDPEWLAEREWLRARGSDIVFFPYTQSTSSTKIKEQIENDK